jgi:hypothetical protein
MSTDNQTEPLPEWMRMTPEEARNWTLSHWNADEDGTDLDIDRMDAAFAAVTGRLPDESDDALAALKKYFLPLLSEGEKHEIETNN